MGFAPPSQIKLFDYSEDVIGKLFPNTDGYIDGQPQTPPYLDFAEQYR